jgi:hypothetical protein
MKKTKKDILFNVLKQSWKLIKKIFYFFRTFGDKHFTASQRIQLSLLYFIAITTLLFSLKRTIGFIPDILKYSIPFCNQIIQSQTIKYFARPETTFFLYLVVIETGINRPSLGLSGILKFNILLVYVLQMIYNLAISWWDVIFIREVLGRKTIIDRLSLYQFLTDLTLFFILLLFYSYICAMRGHYPRYPGILQNIPDSMAFWLRIKDKKLANRLTKDKNNKPKK